MAELTEKAKQALDEIAYLTGLMLAMTLALPLALVILAKRQCQRLCQLLRQHTKRQDGEIRAQGSEHGMYGGGNILPGKVPGRQKLAETVNRHFGFEMVREMEPKDTLTGTPTEAVAPKIRIPGVWLSREAMERGRWPTRFVMYPKQDLVETVMEGDMWNLLLICKGFSDPAAGTVHRVIVDVRACGLANGGQVCKNHQALLAVTLEEWRRGILN